MPSYTFVIKKKNMVFEFKTDNKDFIDKEFEKWVNSISNNVKEEKPKIKKTQEKPPQKILPDKVEEEVCIAMEEKIEATSLKKGIPQEVINEGDLLIQETPSAFQKLSRKLSVETFDEPIEEVEEEPEIIKDKPKKVEVKKEIVQDEDIELELASVSIDGEDDLIELEEVDFSDSEFDTIFQEKLNSDYDEYSVKENKNFIKFKQGKIIEKPMDKLVMIAQYLLEIENKDRFVMKDIMDISAENSIKEIDYALITKAVSLGFVKVVPDLTGVADVVEYALTPKGEDYFNG